MINVTDAEKYHIVDILVNSFYDNKSVNYIIRQDRKRKQRIRSLMDYSFEVCQRFGKVYLSDDKKACALILLPEKKKITPSSILLDLKLITSSIGIGNIGIAMSRESKIKKLQPQEPMYYLWFIGVEPEEQGKGIGSELLQNIIEDAEKESRIICLETSTNRNLPWYQNFGFTIYNELDFGYKLHFLKRGVSI